MIEAVKTVLIVDEDLGFVFWLGHVLSDAGYQVWPARSGKEAADLLTEVGAEIDLLLINADVYDAADFIVAQRSRSDFKIITMQPDGEWRPTIAGAEATLVKPWRPDGLSQYEWISLIERVLTNGDQ